jgi:hypothetical protein
MQNTVLAFTQAKADGDLIDVSDIASEAGFEWPVAVDKAVHAAVSRQADQGLENGLWELLFAARLQAIEFAKTDEAATELEISAVVGRRRGQGVIVRAQLMVGIDEADQCPCVVLLRPPSLDQVKPAQ